MAIDYLRVPTLDLDVFLTILERSGLAARRPVGDRDRIGRMLANSDVIILAREGGGLAPIGVARALTDFSYCCYLADLAVDRAHQGRGVGRRLIEETRKAAGPESMCLLLSSPDGMAFYKAMGVPQPANAFLYQHER